MYIHTKTVTKKPVLEKVERAGKSGSHVVFVLDDSASMQACRDATIDGFNEFLVGQKNSEIETMVSLFKFNGNTVTPVFQKLKVEASEGLSHYTYNPQGMTNLNDGIGEAIEYVNSELKSVPELNRPMVTICVLTDGQENASTRYTNQNVKTLVSQAEELGWSFMFMGANIDAFSVGMQFGFRHENTLSYSVDKMGSTMASASRMANSLKAAYSAGADTTQAYTTSAFTDTERKDTK